MKEKTGKCLEDRRRGGAPLEANGTEKEKSARFFTKAKIQNETPV